MAITPALLRSKDVAHILDISPDDVALLALRKKLKAVKQGRIWKYHPKDVAAYKRRVERRTKHNPS